ncbi:4-hydroxyphenylpyruvate dioxygenase [Umezakia ovalisporum]|jgi:4-hydroxyphenylpyruvate dioxygenase|uniref:4-hydroxyphenylpyruvate dioxygenase n=2 Tax=Umezakia ovalisporum TaxID=75695 RepID=A0AA43GY77_9CYAN|nr:4-hydroxyphenylpyruvate dioxygenase [Umezakia ovalisporum]MBI1240356.1 4-hydroxyphenylpyruvate dioxygenase [Nostoc sp. RI_552]MDH6058225.1 4-hydroxyphenylpyruvate dioxygenase [Umezakia ovalisporum FSS-43]MDH6063796.1 4-hydroxyphenylpyruvate dioxygenase [Umezakia ovalisporum FSS-62]MDH6066967.1 4-hydroxyphenylpyruvate dioxygenase [Umezakia ovalisporum APH033B]MDH6072338.1 4-hydroxyphenylpyruvate dioxygenase [Umezakia ovalisporum CobakiLakeA]
MKIDHVHFYVEDAKVWRDWFVNHLGFTAIHSRMTSQHTCTEVVSSGTIRFLLSSALLPKSPVAEFLNQHPPGVADVAFAVEDVEGAMALAQKYGARVIQPIKSQQYGDVSRKWGKIAPWGGLSHTLVEVSGVTRDYVPQTTDHTFTAIDHIVLNVPGGELKTAVAWYEKVLDFQPQQSFKIQTERSALYSQVMVSRNGGVQLPINEPASSNSQIQEFLNVNRGPGIQHIALGTPNLVSAIAQFRARGLSLLSVPQSYYSRIQQRRGFPLSMVELEAIAQQEILVDWKEDTQNSVLLQIFTEPIFGQPTFFFEFIERRYQAKGFGEGNFRALFEAMEGEQIKRGTLQ